jgi:DnaD/phage-associated family protein
VTFASSQRAFGGFPARAQATAIPHVFFTDLLPQLAHDAVTLGVTLYAFHALRRKKGFPRYITGDDLAGEPAMLSYLINTDSDETAIAHGLEHASSIGAFLRLQMERDGAPVDLYFLNTPADRRGLEAVRAGTVDVGMLTPATRVPPALARSNVFTLYESLVGTLSPLVADELAEAERLYPQEWLERAFREAAAQNVRSWRYVSRILERWSVEGPDHEKADRDPAGDDRYFAGKYGRILKQRLQP